MESSISGHLLYALDAIDLGQISSYETEDELEDRMMREKGQLVVEATWRSCTIEGEDGNMRSEIKQLQIWGRPVVDAQLLLNPRRGEDQGLYICMSPITGEQATQEPEEIVKILPEGYIRYKDSGEADDDTSQLSSEARDQLYADFYARFPYANDEDIPHNTLIKRIVSLYTTAEEYSDFAVEYDDRELRIAALYNENS